MPVSIATAETINMSPVLMRFPLLDPQWLGRTIATPSEHFILLG
jgi:hypothetical protein